MAKTKLKNRTYFSNAIDTDLLNKLKEYSLETGIPMSKLFDKSIELYLKHIEKQGY